MHLLRYHLHAATISVTLIALGASIAFSFAATDTRTNRFLDSFITGGSNSSLDLAALIGHPCYEIVGIEATMCQEQYGLTESLHSMLDRGVIAAYVRSRGVPVPAGAIGSPSAQSASPAPTESMGSPELSPSSEPVTESALPQYQRLLIERGQLLWRICQDRYIGRDAYRCYARNTRILTRFDTPIAGSVW